MEMTINGRAVTAKDNETVLDCALRHGIDIPHLCTHPSLPPYGACRLCVVEIDGMRGFPSSCTTPVSAGMVVRTDTEQLRELRGNILGLMLLEHPSGCLMCKRRDLCEEFRPMAEKSGRTSGCHTCSSKDVCELRALSEELGVSALPVVPGYQNRPIERKNPFIDRDLNLCVLCGRCVRVCKHQHDTAIIDLVGRSSQSMIGEAFGRSLKDAGCRFCGSCVDVCPTGSLGDRYAKWFGRPDSQVETTCAICEAGCALAVGVKEGMAVTARALDCSKPLCVLGRFGNAEFLNGVERLRKAFIRVGDVLRESSIDDALKAAASRLREFAGDRFAFITGDFVTLEDRYVFKKFTTEIMKSSNYIELTTDTNGYARALLPEGVKAVFTTGDLLDKADLDSLDFIAVSDCYPSAVSRMADVVFPVAVLSETGGTVIDSTDAARPLYPACEPPGDSRQDWITVSGVAGAMGESGLDYRAVEDIAAEAGIPAASLHYERVESPPAGKDPSVRRSWFRGHLLEDRVGGLRELPVQGVPVREDGTVRSVEQTVAPPAGDLPFVILKKREISPNNHEIVFSAPPVARKALPGQFVIVMADETSERVPYTLCGWDASAGTITLVVQEKGQSSRKLALMSEGDAVPHIVGPLGTPMEIRKYGTVLLAGGCYGIGAILPVAPAMKEAGNRVIVVSEARSHYVAYYAGELAEVSDEFIQATMDGSSGVKGHAVDVIVEKLAAGESIDLVVTVGCTFMMMITAEATKPYNVKTLAALNPIMVDGTGMCGACRVTEGGKTRFACVDGPFFDAHLIDWGEVKDRRAAYSAEEIRSLLRTESVEKNTGRACGGACR